MEDAGFMRRGEGLGDFVEDAQRLRLSEGRALDPVREVLAFQKIQHQEADAVLGDVEGVDGDDAGVSERRQSLGLTSEARHRSRLDRALRQQNLHRIRTPGSNVGGEVYGTDAAGTQTFADSVGPELPPLDCVGILLRHAVVGAG